MGPVLEVPWEATPGLSVFVFQQVGCFPVRTVCRGQPPLHAPKHTAIFTYGCLQFRCFPAGGVPQSEPEAPNPFPTPTPPLSLQPLRTEVRNTPGDTWGPGTAGRRRLRSWSLLWEQTGP